VASSQTAKSAPSARPCSDRSVKPNPRRGRSLPLTTRATDVAVAFRLASSDSYTVFLVCLYLLNQSIKDPDKPHTQRCHVSAPPQTAANPASRSDAGLRGVNKGGTAASREKCTAPVVYIIYGLALRDFPTPGQRGHNPQRHTAAGAAAH